MINSAQGNKKSKPYILTISNIFFFSILYSEYESAMSDIEETMSILSRRSRSTTPISATLQRSVSENRVTGNRITGNNHFTNPAFALETLLENTPYGSLDRRLKTKGMYGFY